MSKRSEEEEEKEEEQKEGKKEDKDLRGERAKLTDETAG